MTKPYNPCPNGIHVCGADVAADEFFSEANYPGATIEQFSRARAELAAGDDDPMEFVVDMMVAGDIADDFAITRQMLPRLAQICGAP